jgi:hypothetical protein
MTGAYARPLVPVEIFVEERQVPPVRIVVIARIAAVNRPPPLLLPQKDARQPPRQLRRHLPQRRQAKNALDFPVVLKPVGERGSGVAIGRGPGEPEEYLRTAESDTIIQQYVPGVECGVFYIRYPGAARGRIFSITEKRFPDVTGDGLATTEQLIKRDPKIGLRGRCVSQETPGETHS